MLVGETKTFFCGVSAANSAINRKPKTFWASRIAFSPVWAARGNAPSNPTSSRTLRHCRRIDRVDLHDDAAELAAPQLDYMFIDLYDNAGNGLPFDV